MGYIEQYKKDDLVIKIPNIEGNISHYYVISFPGNTVYKDGKKYHIEGFWKAEEDNYYIFAEKLGDIFGACEGVMSVKNYCEGFLKRKYLFHELGLVIISDDDIDLTEETIWNISDYMVYDRPTQMQIKDIFYERGNDHPRIMVGASDVERIKEYCKTDRYMKAFYDELVAEAEAYIKRPNVKYDVVTHGTLLETCREVRDVCFCLGMAYMLTKDKRYSDRIWEEVKSTADFKDWGNDGCYLATAEMMAAYAIGYDWAYDAWSAEQRDFIFETAMRQGMQLSYKAYYGKLNGSPTNTEWMLRDNNWNSVCNGGTTMAAIAFFDSNPGFCAFLIEQGLLSLEIMMRMFYPDGAWFEGIGYWSYASRYLLMMMSTVKVTFGTYFGITSAPGFDKTGRYSINQDGPNGCNNFHDCTDCHLEGRYLMWYAGVLGQPELGKARLYGLEHYEGHRFCIYDFLFYRKEYGNAEFNVPLDSYSSSVELVLMRSEFGNENATFASLHAGAVNCNHSHIDAGAFVFDMCGERWACDLGSEAYNFEGYFDHSGPRWNFYRTRGEGHNIFLINPDEKPGQLLDAFIPVTEFNRDKDNPYVRIDLTSAYRDSVDNAVRILSLTDKRQNVMVCDSIELKEQSDLYWFMHTDAEIELIDNQTAVLKKNGKQIKAVLTTNLPDASLCVMAAKPLETSPMVKGQNENEGIRKLTVKGNGAGEIYIQVKFVRFNTSAEKITPENIFHNNGQIPDGE